MDKNAHQGAIMDIKKLHAADAIRHAIAGHILLSKEERDAAVASLIEKVEKANIRANSARAKGFYHTADIIDRLVDSNLEEVDKLLSLPVICDEPYSWTGNEFLHLSLQA